jgi:L-ascorbate metabolism protein UlaG (beta-lactamase superfamily)
VFRSPFPKHFDGKRFYNPGAPQARGWLEVLQWKFTSWPERSPRFLADVKPANPPARVEGSELRVTLVNHSTVLLQQHGMNILTDPIWSEWASPFASVGPRRHRDPGVRWEDLPAIHLVLLSHNHYDHLDVPTLRRLRERGESQYVAPLGLAPLLRSEKIGPVRELDWGESAVLGEVTIHCVPAMHFSARGIFDRNRTLWCGYVMASAGRTIYFAGDTAFGEHFAAIREQFGAPRLALLPIGSYEPRWFMAPVHMGPGEAVRAHRILGARTSIAIHHGTFQLADDGIDTPRKRVAESGVDDSFLVLGNGQQVALE